MPIPRRLGDWPGWEPWRADASRVRRWQKGWRARDCAGGSGGSPWVCCCCARLLSLRPLPIRAPGIREFLGHQIRRFRLIQGEQLGQAFRIGSFEVVGAVALLKRQPDVAIAAATIPRQIPDAFHILQIHGEALEAIGDLDRYRPAIDAAALLEIGELGHLHAIEPHLPTHTPGPEGW